MLLVHISHIFSGYRHQNDICRRLASNVWHAIAPKTLPAQVDVLCGATGALAAGKKGNRPPTPANAMCQWAKKQANGIRCKVLICLLTSAI